MEPAGNAHAAPGQDSKMSDLLDRRCCSRLLVFMRASASFNHSESNYYCLDERAGASYIVEVTALPSSALT